MRRRLGREVLDYAVDPFISGIFAGDAVLNTWWVLVLVLVGKTITTGLTMAGSGSAGLLVPSMYLGGVSGALVAHLANLTGWTQLDPALFAVVGVEVLA